MLSTTAGSIGIIRTEANKLGIELPEEVAHAIERADLLGTAGGYFTAGTADLDRAIVNAIERGKDPASDREVQKLVIANYLATTGRNTVLTTIGIDGIRDAIITQRHTILGLASTAFDRAVAALQSASEALGPIDLDKPADVDRVSPAAAHHLQAAMRGRAAVRSALGIWRSLNSIVAFAPLDHRRQMLVMAVPTLDQFIDLRLEGRTIDAWTAISAGLSLSLAQPGELEQRVNELREAEERRSEADQRATRGVLA